MIYNYDSLFPRIDGPFRLPKCQPASLVYLLKI